MHNIFAYTEPGALSPQFISLNHDGKGRVELTVRSTPFADEVYGPTATAVIDHEVLRELARTLYSYACTSSA